MIRSRESLNKLADAINSEIAAFANAHGKEVPAPLSTKEAIEFNLTTAFAKFQKFMDESHSEDEIEIALTPVRNAINFVNDEIRQERLEAMVKMPYRDAFLDYLRTQCVKGYRITTTKEGNYILDAEASIALDAYDFVSALCSADMNGIIDACCIFADNVARFAISDAAAVSKNSMHQSYIDLRERKGWNLKKSELSLTSLAGQMTEIAKMISCGVAPKMLNADVKYVMHSIIQSKDVADSAGKFMKRDERTVVRFVFRALYTRYNNLPYDFQDVSRAKNGAMGIQNNKAMHEPKPEKDAMPEAGKVTLVEESKKAKKTAKKTEETQKA